jgi:hypothetical protein
MLRAEEGAVIRRTRHACHAYTLALATFVLLFASLRDRAQAQESTDSLRLSVSAAWLDQAVEQQSKADWRRRYVAGPGFAALGVGALIWPFAAKSGTPATITSLATGAALLTTSIGTWANSDPYLAERWGARFAHLAALGFGATAIAECASPTANAPCSGASTPVKHLVVALGAWEIGYQLSLLALDLLLPPPDPREVKLAVQGPADADYASVLAFLKQREHRRRIEAYIAFPLLILPPAGLFYFGAQLNEPSGRTVSYAFASVFTVLMAAALVYELLRTPDDLLLQRGQAPSD